MTAVPELLESWSNGSEPSVDHKFTVKKKLLQHGSDLLRSDHRVIRGDARDLALATPAESAHLVVTSPPYWDLKQYEDDQGGAQLGHIADRREFLDSLNEVWAACHRLLVPGGRLCIVVGDVCRSRKTFGRHIVEPLHAYLQVECQRVGFDPLAPIIWHKITNMTTEVGGSGATLGKPYEPNAVIKNDIEFILLFRKSGGYRKPSVEQRVLSLIDRADHQRWFRQIWSDVTGELQRGHPAPFPMEIPRRLISMFSFVGDTVIDPFLGTGATTLAAMSLHRNSIGVELEPKYVELAMRRIGTPPLNATVTRTDGFGDQT